MYEVRKYESTVNKNITKFSLRKKCDKLNFKIIVT